MIASVNGVSERQVFSKILPKIAKQKGDVVVSTSRKVNEQIIVQKLR